MGCKEILKDFLFNIDLFGKEPKLYYKGKSKIKTILGIISTILYAIIYISFFAYKINLMLKKKDVNYYETTVNTEKIPSIQLTNEIFYPAFALMNVYTGQTFIDDSLYYAKAFLINVENNNLKSKEPLDIEKCKIENSDSPHSKGDFYCIKNINDLLELKIGSANYSFISIQIFPCVKQSFCAPQYDVIGNLRANNIVVLYLDDVELTPQVYKNPVIFSKRLFFFDNREDLFYSSYIRLKKIKIETDEDNIGFNENIKTKNYLKTDEVSRDEKEQKLDIFESNEFPMSEIGIELSESVFTIRRKYTKLIDVLGTVGGFMGVIYILFSSMYIFFN